MPSRRSSAMQGAASAMPWGMLTVTSAPPPSASPSTMKPPISRTKPDTMGSPSPSPPVDWVRPELRL